MIDALTDAVEEAVLQEFERLAERGGVLGAMETLYQRAKIQEESLHYETRKHSGALPIVGVNTFVRDDAERDVGERAARADPLRRCREAAPARQSARLPGAARRSRRTPRSRGSRPTAVAGGNLFDALMQTVEVASLGQISDALFAVGGRYRRAM